MVKIGTVWDSAVDAARGRAGVVLPIAAAALFLPSVVQTGAASYLAQPGGASATAASAAPGALALPLMVVTSWGALAVTAVFLNPDTTRGDAVRQATARLLPLLGVWLVLGFAVAALIVPLAILLIAAGVDLQQAATPGYRPDLSGGAALSAVLYMILAAGLLVWLLARLALLVPVVLRERLGLGALGRSFRLTRGMGGRLVGLLVLYGVVLGVSTLAITAVLGLVFRLLLGAENAATAAFLGGVAGAVVSTVLAVLSYAFVARLYSALGGSDLRAVFEDAPAT